jgi:hypothetical protein
MVELPKKILIVTNDKVFTPLASIQIVFSEPGTDIRQFETPDAIFDDLSVADCLDLVVYHLPTANPEKEIGRAISFLQSFNSLFPNSPFPDIIFTSAKIGVAEVARDQACSLMGGVPAGLSNILGITAVEDNEIYYTTDLVRTGKITNSNFLFPSRPYEFLRTTYNYQFPSFEGKFSSLSAFDQKEIARQIDLIERDLTRKNPGDMRQSERPEFRHPKPANEEPGGFK